MIKRLSYTINDNNPHSHAKKKLKYWIISSSQSSLSKNARCSMLIKKRKDTIDIKNKSTNLSHPKTNSTHPSPSMSSSYYPQVKNNYNTISLLTCSALSSFDSFLPPPHPSFCAPTAETKEKQQKYKLQVFARANSQKTSAGSAKKTDLTHPGRHLLTRHALCFKEEKRRNPAKPRASPSSSTSSSKSQTLKLKAEWILRSYITFPSQSQSPSKNPSKPIKNALPSPKEKIEKKEKKDLLACERFALIPVG